jgi:hypothetical protein
MLAASFRRLRFFRNSGLDSAIDSLTDRGWYDEQLLRKVKKGLGKKPMRMEF